VITETWLPSSHTEGNTMSDTYIPTEQVASIIENFSYENPSALEFDLTTKPSMVIIQVEEGCPKRLA
jgi:hypothetical protein